MSIVKVVTFLIDKDLKKVNGKDKDKLLCYINKNYKGESLPTIKGQLKFIWKLLFPKSKLMGDLNGKIDKSRQKLRTDKLDWGDYLWFFYCTYFFPCYNNCLHPRL